MITLLEKVWLACAIDSEGSIVIGKAYRKGDGPIYVPIINVSNTHLGYVKYANKLIKKATGGSLLIEATKGKYSPVYRAIISSFPRVISLLKLISPYLIVKKSRALNLLKWQKHREWKMGNKKRMRYDKKDLYFISKGRETDHSKWLNKKTLERTIK